MPYYPIQVENFKCMAAEPYKLDKFTPEDKIIAEELCSCKIISESQIVLKKAPDPAATWGGNDLL